MNKSDALLAFIAVAALSTADAFSLSTTKIAHHVKRANPSVSSPMQRYPMPCTAPMKREHNIPPITTRNKSTKLFSSASSAEESLPRLDRVLSKLTSFFPLFVLGSAILGSYVPSALNWVNTGNCISMMLAG